MKQAVLSEASSMAFYLHIFYFLNSQEKNVVAQLTEIRPKYKFCFYLKAVHSDQSWALQTHTWSLA